MSKEIRIKREDALRALRHLEMIVLSLDHIGSASTNMSKEEYDRVSSEFLDDWDVARRLADVRRILSEQFPDEPGDDGTDELERELEGTPHWKPLATRPPADAD